MQMPRVDAELLCLAQLVDWNWARTSEASRAHGRVLWCGKGRKNGGSKEIKRYRFNKDGCGRGGALATCLGWELNQTNLGGSLDAGGVGVAQSLGRSGRRRLGSPETRRADQGGQNKESRGDGWPCDR